jgi:hypothetical protein
MSAVTDKPKTKRQLEKEIEKLRSQIARMEKPKPVKVIDRVHPKKEPRIIRAGEFLPKHQNVVVDEVDNLAFAHPASPTIANRRKFWGKTEGEYQQGEAVSIKLWWLDLDSEDEA